MVVWLSLTFTSMRPGNSHGINVRDQIYPLIKAVRLGCGIPPSLPVGRGPAGRTDADAFRCDVVVPHADSSRVDLRRIALEALTDVDPATHPQRGSRVMTSSKGPTRNQRYP
jgi:hypothetical protein